MGLPAAITEFRSVRADARPKKPRTPITIRLARAAAKALPRWSALRRVGLVLGGFGALDYAAWQVNQIAGCAAIGISLLIIDALSGADGDSR